MRALRAGGAAVPGSGARAGVDAVRRAFPEWALATRVRAGAAAGGGGKPDGVLPGGGRVPGAGRLSPGAGSARRRDRGGGGGLGRWAGVLATLGAVRARLRRRCRGAACAGGVRDRKCPLRGPGPGRLPGSGYVHAGGEVARTPRFTVHRRRGAGTRVEPGPCVRLGGLRHGLRERGPDSARNARAPGAACRRRLAGRGHGPVSGEPGYRGAGVAGVLRLRPAARAPPGGVGRHRRAGTDHADARVHPRQLY